MTITDLRESDAHTYKFRFYTDGPEDKYTGEPGVTLSVTESPADLKVTVSDTDGGVKKLTCSSTCTLPNPTYIWYKNRQPVFNQNRNELNLRDRTVDAGSYSCAVKGYEELRSPAVCVFDLQVKVEGPAATASEGQTVTLTCNSTCTLPSNPTYIWYKNGQPVSQCESASCSVAVVSEVVNYSCAVEGSDHSPPVCEFISSPH
ncbi:sialoadhesin-like [Colossoma macropomum]|uniref:sialoadhesin-like n=1 Tax=Colossoma macropomum TaxID=42526 RepID=UPI00186478C2|nr:sialoadhesin-like [Colossoma macropomum]